MFFLWNTTCWMLIALWNASGNFYSNLSIENELMHPKNSFLMWNRENTSQIRKWCRLILIKWIVCSLVTVCANRYIQSLTVDNNLPRMNEMSYKMAFVYTSNWNFFSNTLNVWFIFWLPIFINTCWLLVHHTVEYRILWSSLSYKHTFITFRHTAP